MKGTKPELEPIDYRGQHDPVEWSKGQITDHHGDIGSPRIVVDTLKAMVRCGTLSEAQERAAREFQDDFTVAHLDQLRANDLMQPLSGKGGQIGAYGRTVSDARSRIGDVIKRLGGIGSPAGRMAWEILGEQRSIREHCERTILAPGRTLNRRTASAMLVDVCEALRLHYEIPDD